MMLHALLATIQLFVSLAARATITRPMLTMHFVKLALQAVLHALQEEYVQLASQGIDCQLLPAAPAHLYALLVLQEDALLATQEQ